MHAQAAGVAPAGVQEATGATGGYRTIPAAAAPSALLGVMHDAMALRCRLDLQHLGGGGQRAAAHDEAEGAAAACAPLSQGPVGGQRREAQPAG